MHLRAIFADLRVCLLRAFQDFDADTSARIISKTKEELAHRRISRQMLADTARISLSTLDKMLSRHRPLTLATVIKLEDALGLSLREQVKEEPPVPQASPLVGPQSMGAYSRDGVKWAIGKYLTIRPSFSNSEAIYTYVTRLFWDDAGGHLGFAESDRDDSWFEQTGHVTISNLSGHIYLVTNSEGQYRTLTLGRSQKYNALLGILSTLAMVDGARGMPMACPIVLIPMDEADERRLGTFLPRDEGFAQYREFLNHVTAANFAQFAK